MTVRVEDTLLALGFTQGDDGELRAPPSSTVKFMPLDSGDFYRVSIGNAVQFVVAACAIKVGREGR